MITDAFQLPRLEQSPRLWALALNLTLAPCVGELEEEESNRVVLVMMSEKRLDPTRVKDLLTQALSDYRGERLPVHPETPMLGEFMQRSSWRLAVHGARTAKLRSLHTTQTEIWLRDDADDAYPVLCQAFSPDPDRIDEMLDAASAFRWAPTEQSLRGGE
ncbi:MULTISPECIES: hypothetical protein [Pandoraea]|uniref:Uncharacterized protein n=2 Tax=Pandoraea TaxID=93217 RepID=A0A5E4XDD3_9BURK|nr:MULTISPECIES: hypothetical protein [Pandoraea]VVE16573.1 hypothetical protein PCE31107_02926 [Pandoraea cepalis]VVE34419.1 hypothetical protein PTE31013_03847 [Pandoraea terrigena]